MIGLPVCDAAVPSRRRRDELLRYTDQMPGLGQNTTSRRVGPSLEQLDAMRRALRPNSSLRGTRKESKQ